MSAQVYGKQMSENSAPTLMECVCPALIQRAAVPARTVAAAPFRSCNP